MLLPGLCARNHEKVPRPESGDEAAHLPRATFLERQPAARSAKDEVIEEPLGGAHRGKDESVAAVGDAIERNLLALLKDDGPALRQKRRDKFLAMGQQGLA